MFMILEEGQIIFDERVKVMFVIKSLNSQDGNGRFFLVVDGGKNRIILNLPNKTKYYIDMMHHSLLLYFSLVGNFKGFI